MDKMTTYGILDELQTRRELQVFSFATKAIHIVRLIYLESVIVMHCSSIDSPLLATLVQPNGVELYSVNSFSSRHVGVLCNYYVGPKCHYRLPISQILSCECSS